MSTTSLKPEVSSVNEIRKHFPALERVHNGYPVAYFDGPGGTQVPRYVVEQMADYLYHHNANTHWAYPTSAETDAALEHAREVFAEFLNASPTEIAFGANMTTLTLHLSRALSLNYKPGDEIVVTELDHHANIDPWRRLAVERGVTIRTVRMDTTTGQLNTTISNVYRSKNKTAGDRRRLKRPRNDQRSQERDRDGAQRRRARVCRRGSLRAARVDRREGS